MKTTIWIKSLFILVLLTGFVYPAHAQSSGPSMSAEAAFDGNFKYGEWLPVMVELENQGADVDAEVRVSVEGSTGANVFTAPVALPSGSRKRITLYVLPNNFTRELVVQLVGPKGLLASQKVEVSPHANYTFIVGLVSPKRGAMALMQGITFSGQERPKLLADLSLADIPERMEGLFSFDALVLNDTDTSSLTPAQAAALQGWVEEGGRLVIGGGAGAAQTLSGLPPELLPGELTGSLEVETADLTGLVDFAGTEPLRVPGPFVLAQMEATYGNPLAGDDEIPLVSERQDGAGKVDFIGLDLSGVPFDGWPGTQAFWQALLVPGAYYPLNTPPDMSIRQLRMDSIYYALSNMPMLDLPSVTSLSLLLGIYILLVGPANYLVLRWRKRLHLAWITIPAITLVFSAAAFGIGYLMRGTDVVLNRIAVVNLQADGSSKVTSYLGLFSPGSQEYEIEVDAAGLISPATTAYYSDPWGKGGVSSPENEMVFVQSDPASVRGLSVTQWSMQSFMTEDTWSDFGRLAADLSLNGTDLTGTLRNETRFTLKDARIVFARRILRLGDIAPGATVDVDLDLTTLEPQFFGPVLSWQMFQDEFNNPGPNGPPRALEVKRAIVESVFERGPWMKRIPGATSTTSNGAGSGPLFLGWIDQAPPVVSVDGDEPAQQTTGLVYTTLDYHLPETGAFVLPPGLIPGALTKQPRDGGTCGDMTMPSVFLMSGEAEFEFQVPADMRDYQIDAIQLSVMTDSGGIDLPTIEVFNWDSQEWLALENAQMGLNTVPDPDGMISEAGVVRLRLTSENNFGKGCMFLNMGLQATRLPTQGG